MARYTFKTTILDSKEPKQNIDIYNYRARKYNKLIKQDYFITDVESINNVFKSAFPLEETEIVACGYPRNEYLLEQHSNSNEINKIKQQLNLNTKKETILYTPTWRDNQEEEFLLEFTDEMKAKYNIIYKYHEEDHANKQHNYIDTRQFETQQLLLVSDIVISDYSSIVFDALTIDKKCTYIHQILIIMIITEVYIKKFMKLSMIINILNSHYCLMQL